MNLTIKTLFALIKCALTKEPFNIDKGVDWNTVYQIASIHRITTLVYYGIKEADAELPDDIKAKFEDKLYKSTMLRISNDYEVERILSAFSENSIFHAPLKGIAAKALYPEPEMRTVGDADIYIKEEELDKISRILSELGFVFDHESVHEHVWKKKNLLLELHKSFMSKAVEKYFDYYKNRENILKATETPFLYQMPTNELLIYLMIHIAKHYQTGGIGIRHFIDIYIILNSCDKPDERYVYEQFEKIGLNRFFLNVKNMLACWFDGREYDSISSEMTKRIIESGIFGNSKNRFVADAMHHSLIKKVFSTVFLPSKYMKEKYSVLEKAPMLLPVFWVYRIFNILFNKSGKVKSYKNKLKLANKDNLSDYKNHLKFVGLE